MAAALVAALGTLLVFLYVRGADTRAEQRFDTVDVLRATAVIEAGETIESASANAKLELQAVPQDQLIEGYLTSIDQVAGQVALTQIYPGEQIITSKFGGAGESTSSLQIPKGKLAISVNLTDPARVAGFVNPGSQIAVFVNGTDLDSGESYTRLLLQRVTVLGVGSTTLISTTTTDPGGQQTTEQLPRTLLTIAVDQDEAQRVLYASSNGELAFGLLTPTSSVGRSPGVTGQNLFE